MHISSDSILGGCELGLFSNVDASKTGQRGHNVNQIVDESDRDGQVKFQRESVIE